MSTVSDLITDAMFAVGAAGQGDSISAGDANLCLRRLTRMLGTWANEGLMVYDTVESTPSLIAGTASYASNMVNAGIVSIQNMFIRSSSTDYVVHPTTEQDYDAIAYKSASGMPSVYFFKPTAAAPVLYFYPTPDAAYEVHIKARYPLMSTVALATTITQPSGYEAAMCDNLAVDIASSFGLQPPASLVESARASKMWLKTTNYKPREMVSTILLSGPGQPGYIRILGDT